MYYSETRKRGFRRFNSWLTVPTRSFSTLKIDTEKLDISIKTTQSKERSTMAPKGYRELTEKEKRAALGALLVLEKDGELPHGSFAQIGKKLALAPKSIARLWRAAASTRATRTIQSPKVISKKKGNQAYRRPKLVYDRELMKEEILAIPLWKRSTVRNLRSRNET